MQALILCVLLAGLMVGNAIDVSDEGKKLVSTYHKFIYQQDHHGETYNLSIAHDILTPDVVFTIPAFNIKVSGIEINIMRALISKPEFPDVTNTENHDYVVLKSVIVKMTQKGSTIDFTYRELCASLKDEKLFSTFTRVVLSVTKNNLISHISIHPDVAYFQF